MLLQMITSTLLATTIFIGLIILDWKIAFSCALIIITVYILIAFSAKNLLKFNSKMIASSSQLLMKSLNEGLGSIKDIILSSGYDFFINDYRSADIPQRFLQAKNQFLVGAPRFLLEAAGMLTLTSLGLYISLSKIYKRNNCNTRNPCFGGAKIIAFLAANLWWLGEIKFVSTDLKNILDLLDLTYKKEVHKVELDFNKTHIVGKDLSFKYVGSNRMILNEVSFKINPGEVIGIVGKTGSGKSTFVDIVIGLLKPESGSLKVGGIDIYDPANESYLRSWQSQIAHVPQEIFLRDSTIAENIAFGYQIDQINMTLAREAADLAQLGDMIESNPDGLLQRVGERGANLSGGQKQRLGIARALYRQTNILILDEATSALDRITEQDIIHSLSQLNRKVTIIMIAHRLSTLQICNRIFEFRDNTLSVRQPHVNSHELS